MYDFAVNVQVLKRFRTLGLISLDSCLIPNCAVEISAVFTLVWVVSYCPSFYVKEYVYEDFKEVFE